MHFVITNWHLTHWAEITRAVYQDFEAELVECNGEANHVHLLVNFPPKMAASKLVNPPQEHVLPQAPPGVPRPRPPQLAARRLWPGSYFARSVDTVRGAPLSIVKQYIEQQNRPPWPGPR